MQEYCVKTLSSMCFGYLLESPHWGDSNKYPKHMLYEEIKKHQQQKNKQKKKQGLFNISFCLLRILYNKFILMAMSLGTNAIVVMSVHCKIKNNSKHKIPNSFKIISTERKALLPGWYWLKLLDALFSCLLHVAVGNFRVMSLFQN